VTGLFEKHSERVRGHFAVQRRVEFRRLLDAKGNRKYAHRCKVGFRRVGLFGVGSDPFEYVVRVCGVVFGKVHSLLNRQFEFVG